MRSILEELFYGNICPNTDCRSYDKETKQLMGYIADHHDSLLSTLNDQQKETLEKFDDCYHVIKVSMEITTTEVGQEYFLAAFRSTAFVISFIRLRWRTAVEKRKLVITQH